MAEIKPGDKTYLIPENPIYDPVIRALKTSDPANADTIFNPLFSQIIENVHAVKVANDGKAIQPEGVRVILSAAEWTGSAVPYQQVVSLEGIKSDNQEESLLLISSLGNAEIAGDFQVEASQIQTGKVVFTAVKKPNVNLQFLLINLGTVKK